MNRSKGIILLLLCGAVGIPPLLPDSVWLLVQSTFRSSKQVTGILTCPLGYGDAPNDGTPFIHPYRQGTGSTTTIYTNCTIWTADTDNPFADTLAVSNGRITFVGTHQLALERFKDVKPPPLAVDLRGKYLVPGFIDAHVHLIPAGLLLSRLDLRSITTKQDFIDAVAAAAQGSPKGQWILGGNFDDSAWGGEAPTAGWIDGMTPDNPVFLLRADAHQGLANSAALALSGVTQDTEDPHGGVIQRELGSSRPTGLFKDTAMALITRHIPQPTTEERAAAFTRAAEHALSQGVTSVVDMGRVAFQEGEQAAWDDLEEIYLPLANQGRLPLRIQAFMPLTTWRGVAERVTHLGTSHPSDRLFWGGVKDFADGSLGSRTALMHQPYTDDPGNAGTRAVELEDLKESMGQAHAAGLQIAIHAIGDKAVDDILDIYEDILTSSSGSSTDGDVNPQRHRIEHSQHLSGLEAAHRMAHLGIHTTPNPLHLPLDLPLLVPRLGQERGAAPSKAYAFKTLLEAGVVGAYASDWPVAELSPLRTLQAAINRDRSAAEEAVSVEAALLGLTRDAARVGMMDHVVGVLKQGLRADFVVLDGNPIEMLTGNNNDGQQQQRLPQVVATYIDGECVYGCVKQEVVTKRKAPSRTEL